MRSTRTKAKTKPGPPATAVKRVVVDFPAPLFSRTERVTAELSMNRSELIRTAVEKYLEALQKARIEQDLAEGYTANAAQARHTCEELAYVDSEVS